MPDKRNFWIRASLINLAFVAFLGLLLRSKILFSIPFIDFKNLLSSHSHFAFGGWATLVLATLFIYELLPSDVNNKKVYQWILWLINLTSLGMLFTFPFTGYAVLSIIFSTLHIFTNYILAATLIRHIIKFVHEKSIRWLSITALFSLVTSSIGPFGLAYMMASKSFDANLHRDFIYTFLHFSYNGFFTLAVLALFYKKWVDRKGQLTPQMQTFAVIISLSILPSLFLSLLWHNNAVYYAIAILACCLIAIGIYYFCKILLHTWRSPVFEPKLARWLFVLSFLSLALKMILQIGPIFPVLGTLVYGDRPLIIGFLHLVFLAFMTLYILSTIVESGYGWRNNKPVQAPFIVFTIGVVLNEVFLMLQGLGILFSTNSWLYNWLLWINSMVLFIGAKMLAIMKRNP